MKLDHLAYLLISFAVSPSFSMAEEESDPAEIVIGERLTLETRFAQAYFANQGKADPVLENTHTTGAPLRGPFAGKTINCRSCHMIDEHADNPLGGMRSYTDFAARPPVPRRNDGQVTSMRNAMSMVNISRPWVHGNQEAVFHYDGEFNSVEDLVKGTLTGRNFGWKADETALAIKHIANIIRTDDGKGELAREFGGSYSKILSGTDTSLDKEFILPAEYRVDVARASDKQIVDAIAKLISAYVTDLSFEQDAEGNYLASPYDVFLEKNNLPRLPAKDESITAYNQRLLEEVTNLENPSYVNNEDRKFKTHNQNFVFGEKELAGMKLFFRKGNSRQAGGNCSSCHSAPHFSDYGFHNTGLTQKNYDATHGAGRFMKLVVPQLNERNANYNTYLPVTAKHPRASSRFRSHERTDKPGFTDLGLWNVFANPDMPDPQQKITNIVCFQAKAAGGSSCSKQVLLPTTIAAFKTPVLRDLGHSGPYMHTGQFNTVEETVNFYIEASVLSKTGNLRNPDPALDKINLTAKDVDSLVAFINALNEDYE